MTDETRQSRDEKIRRLVEAAISLCEPEDADEKATGYTRETLTKRFREILEPSPRRSEATKGGPTASDPDRPYCKPDQSCCDFCCGN